MREEAVRVSEVAMLLWVTEKSLTLLGTELQLGDSLVAELLVDSEEGHDSLELII